MSRQSEGEAGRARRRYQRGLFDTVARQYAATRPGYPPGLARFVAETAGAGPGAPVLEVGCGTGQLTQTLLPFGFTLTAIDLGASMIEVARERITGDGVAFRVASFEEFEAEPASYDLVISAAAFHWIDPAVRFRQAAQLLRPGGWLALAGYEEQYDEPLGSALDAMWQARPAEAGAWVTRPADAAAITGSGLFGAPLQREFRQRLTRVPEAVIGGEGTRAAALSWPDDVREGFFAELREHLGARAEVGLTLAASVIMAQAAR
jgi:SAM-dependent methyltransferase